MNQRNRIVVFALSLLTLGCSSPEIDDVPELRSGDRLSMDFSVALGEQSYDAAGLNVRRLRNHVAN